MRDLRQQVVKEAETWLLTPYHHMGRVKGAGVDCLTFLAEVYEACGLIEHVEIEFYPPDWHLHRDDERYLEGVLPLAREIEGPPQPGDVALFRFARAFSHGAIVTRWPRIIHAEIGVGVIRGDATGGQLSGREVKFFDPFPA